MIPHAILLSLLLRFLAWFGAIRFAAGSGLTAAADLTISKTIIGASGGYSSPTNNWVACYNTQFTAAAKAGATEWTTASDTNYARQAMGASGAGWTVNAYSSGVGVLWTNINQITQPAPSSTQTLNALGWCDSVGPTGGNINFFCDTASPLTINTGVNVVIVAYAGAGTGAAFTTY